MIVRTQRHMTVTEAHPFHEMTDDGRRALDMGGNAEVWEEFDPRCPLRRLDHPGLPRPAVLETVPHVRRQIRNPSPRHRYRKRLARLRVI